MKSGCFRDRHGFHRTAVTKISEKQKWIKVFMYDFLCTLITGINIITLIQFPPNLCLLFNNKEYKYQL